MEKDWIIVYTQDKSYKADLAIEILAENSIHGVIMNKKDSSYKSFGEFEIYVNKADAEKARELLQISKI